MFICCIFPCGKLNNLYLKNYKRLFNEVRNYDQNFVYFLIKITSSLIFSHEKN